ncbi:hypothetical protein TWF225_011009 [Orbilia oligospora]|nr:hypothetical protein TWF225_011009 [Orbilia oligospora]KAF3271635.1 hypothetical protein TWF128_000200 [Orbilia oligospora]KAF3295123.1 hypothetical protein TWF132_002440 [Orbilia oligospora]
MCLSNAIERERKYEQEEADIRAERDSRIITGATGVGAPVADSNDPEPLELLSRKDILTPLTVNALRYIELGREHVDLPNIKLCFFIFEPVNATGLAVPYFFIRSSDVNPRAPTMRIDIFPPSIRDLSQVYKDVTTLRSVEVFFEPQKVGVLGKIRDFSLALEGKRRIIDCTDRNRSLGGSMPSITTSEFLYRRAWEAAIQKEFEAEDEILKDRLGGQVELALGKEGNGVNHSSYSKFLNGQSISAFCTADQVKEYNNSGLLELKLSKKSDKSLVIAETSPAGQFQLLPCTPVIRKQQQEFTLAEVVKFFDEDTPITGHNNPEYINISQPIGPPPADFFPNLSLTSQLGRLKDFVVTALCKYHELAVRDSESENRQALSPESLVNFLAKSTPKEVERVSGNELQPGDYARLNDLKPPKVSRERNALAHENWGKLAMILDTPECSIHKQNYSRIFAWVVKSRIEDAAVEYASQRPFRNPENWY